MGSAGRIARSIPVITIFVAMSGALLAWDHRRHALTKQTAASTKIGVGSNDVALRVITLSAQPSPSDAPRFSFAPTTHSTEGFSNPLSPRSLAAARLNGRASIHVATAV